METISIKDLADIDPAAFSIIYDDQSLNVKAVGVSEKRQWINQIEGAKKVAVGSRSKPSAVSLKANSDRIGTLKVQLIQTIKCLRPGKYRQIFAVGKIKDQVLKSKVVDAAIDHQCRFNQPLIFSLPSLDDTLQISLYRYDKYSTDGMLC